MEKLQQNLALARNALEAFPFKVPRSIQDPNLHRVEGQRMVKHGSTYQVSQNYV